MSGTTYADRVALGEQLYEHLSQNEGELTARGLNVPYWKGAVRASLEAVKAANERQEALKAELKASTGTVNAADHESYVLTSGGIDAVAGAWGKDSEQGRIVARMRSKLHRASAPPNVQPVGTPPQ